MNRSVRTMAIKAHVISGSDPGAVPGGSTNSMSSIHVIGVNIEGPKQDRRTCKGVLAVRFGIARFPAL